MKNKTVIPSLMLILLFGLCYVASHFINESLAVTSDYAYPYVINENGTNKLAYYCEDTNTHKKYRISIDDAINKFYESQYQNVYNPGGNLYFYRENQINENQYLDGKAAEDADYQVLTYGEAGIRVHSTQELKNKIDDIYSNFKLGEFYFVFSSRENVSVRDAYNYLHSKYGVTDIYRNYYRYDHKGEFEPYRVVISNDELNGMQQSGIFVFDTKPYIYISKEEKNHAAAFISKLLPIILNGAGSTAEKVYRVADYLNGTAPYTYDGINNSVITTYRSIYDLFISRKGVCVGYSIAFAYAMDQLGIESYIVDQITSVDANTGNYDSVHTYNIVKIDGKFYRVDVTMGSSIDAGTSAGLSSHNFNLSTEGIYTGGFHSVWRDNQSVNNLYNQYKSGVSQNYKFYNASNNAPIRDYSPKNVNGTLIEDSNPQTPYDPIDPNQPEISQIINPEDTTTKDTEYYTDPTTTSVINQTNESGEVIGTQVIQDAKYEIEDITNEQGEVVERAIHMAPVTRIVNITNKQGEVVGSTMISYMPETTVINITNEQGEVVGTSIGYVKGAEEDYLSFNAPTNKKAIVNIILISLAGSLVVILVVLRIKNANKVQFSYTQNAVPVTLPTNQPDPYEEYMKEYNKTIENQSKQESTTIANTDINITTIDTNINNEENKQI